MCCIHKYWDGSVVTEGIWFCITGIHVSTFTGGKKLVESLGACPCSRAGLSALHVSIQMTMSTGGKPILHTHTPAFQRFKGVFTRTHVKLQQILKAPGYLTFEAHFIFLWKTLSCLWKNRKLMFFSGPDAGSLLSGTVKRSSEARCLARRKRSRM